jgi:hypothetical protein
LNTFRQRSFASLSQLDDLASFLRADPIGKASGHEQFGVTVVAQASDFGRGRKRNHILFAAEDNQVPN